MKIKVFNYLASKAGWKDNGGGMCIDSSAIEDEINRFCRGKEVVDIKTNTVEYDFHNNGGCNGVSLVYTVIYR